MCLLCLLRVQNKAATLIYHFAKLRDLAKRNIIRTPEKILHLPITALDAVETVEEHVEEIAKEIGNERLELLKSALHLIHQRCVEKSTPTSPNMTIVALSDDSSHYELVYSMGLTIVAFGDDNADKELVYAVGVDWYVNILLFSIIFSFLEFIEVFFLSFFPHSS
jgi:hypothetical protein